MIHTAKNSILNTLGRPPLGTIVARTVGNPDAPSGPKSAMGEQALYERNSRMLAAFSAGRVARFDFTGCTMPASSDWIPDYANSHGFFTLRMIRPQDMGGEFQVQGFSAQLRSTDQAGAGTGAWKSDFAWGTNQGLKAALVMGLASDLPGIVENQWKPIPKMFGCVTPNEDIVRGGSSSSIIARAFPPGNFSDPDKCRSESWLSRDTPLGYRVVNGDAFFVGLAIDGTIARDNSNEAILRGYFGGEILCAIRSESNTFRE